jgi:hypothetical protein
MKARVWRSAHGGGVSPRERTGSRPANATRSQRCVILNTMRKSMQTADRRGARGIGRSGRLRQPRPKSSIEIWGFALEPFGETRDSRAKG